MSPVRAILLHSPGRKPWVMQEYRIFIEPQRGGTTLSKTNACAVVPLLKELLIFVFPVYPGFHFGLCPHYTLGYAGVSCLKALSISLNFDALACYCMRYLDIEVILNLDLRCFVSRFAESPA